MTHRTNHYTSTLTEEELKKILDRPNSRPGIFANAFTHYTRHRNGNEFMLVGRTINAEGSFQNSGEQLSLKIVYKPVTPIKITGFLLIAFLLFGAYKAVFTDDFNLDGEPVAGLTDRLKAIGILFIIWLFAFWFFQIIKQSMVRKVEEDLRLQKVNNAVANNHADH